jgi:hypothetical protein
MLDISHSLADAIFFAAGIEDKIRAHLVAWKNACVMQPQATCHRNVVESLIPNLHALNASRFNTSTGITANLDMLKTLIEGNHCQASWDAFLNFTDRPGGNTNFGTWAI